MSKSLQSLFDSAAALKKRRKFEEAIHIYGQAVSEHPQSAAAEHNLASALGDAGRGSEAEKHVRRAFSKGSNAPQSWLVFARALMVQGKFDEAADAYTRTLQLNPAVLDAHRELAQLTWMTTGDKEAALSALDSALMSFPDVVALHAIKGQVMTHVAEPAATLRFLQASLERWPDDARLLSLAVSAATHSGEPQVALDMSEQLLALQPSSRSARELRVTALLAAGRADEALPMTEVLVEEKPTDQHSLALLATSCRLVGDDRYAKLYDYDQFVRPYELGLPQGWSSLSDYLTDLASALRRRHQFKAHPFSNSLHGGSMIAGLPGMQDPAVVAFQDAIAPAVEAHLAHLGEGNDPLRSRNRGRWRLDGLWSIMLQPNGYHHDHVHPNGWLSSACYIELPDQIDEEKCEGWIKFGEPGLVTAQELPYEHAVKPNSGSVVLFPSYMWHGTVPFGGDQPRLTVAFDVIPD